MFSPHAWSGNLSKRDLGEPVDGNLHNEMELLKKFYTKYPEVKYMPLTGPLNMKYGGQLRFSHPASIFIHKQQKLMKQGYTEHKAFKIVEAELEGLIQKQRDEARILRGVALD
jgi:hypothetical protein